MNADEWPQDLVHESHECARSVRETKRHDKPLVQASLGLERRLPFVPFSHADLMITAPEVDLGKDTRSVQLIEHVIEPRYGVPILDGDVVDGSTVDTHPI